MTKIASRGYCNMKASANIFDATNIKLPTYQEIISTEKFSISGNYENNQLVKEVDVAKYTGQTINNCIVWGEYKQNFNENQYITQSTSIPLTFHITLCYKPDVPIKITFNYAINYLIQSSGSVTDYTKRGSATINISSPSANGGVFGISVKKTDIISPLNNTSILFNTIGIESVTISPVTSTNPSAYNYVVENRGMTKCDSSLLNIKSATLSISDYVDDTTTKTESSKVDLNILFNVPTGTTISSNIRVELGNMNYSDGYSSRQTYAGNQIIYPFGVGDMYGTRGYKLPYYKLDVNVINHVANQTLFLYAIFDPRTTQTGIELTDLITEE
jgi:hypothetical protein